MKLPPEAKKQLRETADELDAAAAHVVREHVQAIKEDPDAEDTYHRMKQAGVLSVARFLMRMGSSHFLNEDD